MLAGSISRLADAASSLLWTKGSIHIHAFWLHRFFVFLSDQWYRHGYKLPLDKIVWFIIFILNNLLVKTACTLWFVFSNENYQSWWYWWNIFPVFPSPVFPIPSYYSYSFEYSSLSSRQSGECDCRRGCFSFQVINHGAFSRPTNGNTIHLSQGRLYNRIWGWDFRYL